jgi:hypothetical protein
MLQINKYTCLHKKSTFSWMYNSNRAQEYAVC